LVRLFSLTFPSGAENSVFTFLLLPLPMLFFFIFLFLSPIGLYLFFVSSSLQTRFRFIPEGASSLIFFLIFWPGFFPEVLLLFPKVVHPFFPFSSSCLFFLGKCRVVRVFCLTPFLSSFTILFSLFFPPSLPQSYDVLMSTSLWWLPPPRSYVYLLFARRCVGLSLQSFFLVIV